LGDDKQYEAIIRLDTQPPPETARVTLCPLQVKQRNWSEDEIKSAMTTFGETSIKFRLCIQLKKSRVKTL
jgi:hypothetical protein